MRLEEDRLHKEGRTPDAITKEAALLQYVVHSRLDKWLEDMLVDMYSTVIPPNPFPTAVHSMRQLAMRLLYKDNRNETMILKSYKHDTVTQLGAGGHVYTKNRLVFGTYLAVCYINPATINPALEALRDFRNTGSKVRQGAFEMRVTTSLRNECFTFSDAVPQSLSKLVLVEDYFVTSLDRDKGYDVFADAVLNHAVALHEGPGHLVAALHTDTGREETSHSWSLQELKSERSRVQVDLKQMLRDKHRIWIEAYARIGSQYIAVSKDCVLHFQDARAKGHVERLAPPEPMALHSSIFLEQEEAEYFISTMKEVEDPYTWQQLEKHRRNAEEKIVALEAGILTAFNGH